MADTAIAITAGTGTNVDTRTEATNGNHRQVVVLGDPSTNAGVAPVDATKGLAVDLTATGANTTALKVNVASGGIASGALAAGSLASGALASGAVASGAYASGSISDGANVAIGATTDAASATGTVSSKLRAIATALGTTALDLGVGTGGSRTLRVAIDTSQTEGSEYETVAAAQTAQVLGGSGASGDFISGLLVIPATTSPGNVLLLDNATSITIFAGGADSVSNLVPFYVPLGMFSVSGAWKVTTGANVSVIGIGNFT